MQYSQIAVNQLVMCTGTHVAATAIGRSVGVAKSANLVAVRVLDCTGSGSISDTIAGIDWVAANARRPAVAIMSLGGESWILLVPNLATVPVLAVGCPVAIGYLVVIPIPFPW